MLGNMTKGMNEVTPMKVGTRSTSTTSKNFHTESKEGGSSTKVVVVIGVVLSNKSLKNGFVVNLSNETVSISGNDLNDFQYYQQMSVDDPTVGINHVDDQVTWVNGHVQ